MPHVFLEGMAAETKHRFTPLKSHSHQLENEPQWLYTFIAVTFFCWHAHLTNVSRRQLMIQSKKVHGRESMNHQFVYNKQIGNHVSISIRDRPLAKVARPEGSPKIVTFGSQKGSFCLLWLVRRGVTTFPDWRSFEELVKVLHPKVTSRILGTRRATRRWWTIEAKNHKARRRFSPKVARHHETCDPGRSIQVGLSYLAKLPNTPDVISQPPGWPEGCFRNVVIRLGV